MVPFAFCASDLTVLKQLLGFARSMWSCRFPACAVVLSVWESTKLLENHFTFKAFMPHVPLPEAQPVQACGMALCPTWGAVSWPCAPRHSGSVLWEPRQLGG